MIDEFSRYISVGALVTTKKTQVFVKAFVITWARYLGYPLSLFFDNGGEFNSDLVREFAENFNINHKIGMILMFGMNSILILITSLFNKLTFSNYSVVTLQYFSRTLIYEMLSNVECNLPK